MRYLLLLLLLPCAAQAGVHRQAAADVLEPATRTPTHINTLPAAVGVRPPVQPEVSETAKSPPIKSAIATSASVVSATAVSPTELIPSPVAPEQCVAGLRVLTQLALLGYDTRANRVFMRIATAAALAEPYAANNVPPNLKVLEEAIDDLPVNGPTVREINQAMNITRTACRGIVKN